MPTLQRFLADAAARGDAVNILFEERLFHLAGIPHKIADALASERIPNKPLRNGDSSFVMPPRSTCRSTETRKRQRIRLTWSLVGRKFVHASGQGSGPYSQPG